MSDEKDKPKLKVHSVAIKDQDDADKRMREEAQRIADLEEDDGIAICGRMTEHGPVGEIVLSKRLRDNPKAKLPALPPIGELDDIREMPALGLMCLVDALKKVAILYGERGQITDALEAVRQMRALMTLTEEKVREERAKAGVEPEAPCDCPNCVGRRVMALAGTDEDGEESDAGKTRAQAALEAWTPSGPAN